MKNHYSFFIGLLTICLLTGFSATSQAQSFKKGSLLISISEGATWANYRTNEIVNGHSSEYHSENITGLRDPLIIEYGVSRRIGIGLSSGADFFKVDPAKFYGFNVPEGNVKAGTSEFTFDLNYHVYSGNKLDLSVFASVGGFNVTMKGQQGDVAYDYNASGGIIRLGTKARYYFYKRLGLFAMFSTYSGSATPEEAKGCNKEVNTMILDKKFYSTTLNGAALEGGLCYRFLK